MEDLGLVIAACGAMFASAGTQVFFFVDTGKDGKKNTGKNGSKRKKQRRQEWRQSKEGSKVTFTDVERLFMKLMKGASEEDWIFLANFERDDYTRGVSMNQSPYLGRGVTF